MHKLFGLVILVSTSLPGLCQTPAAKYQPGTIMAVTRHQNTPAEGDSGIPRYEVSIKVGNTIYVGLYTPPDGSNQVEYSAGIERLVSVGTDTLTLPSSRSGTVEVPILRRETLPAQSGFDIAKAPGQYFTMKMQNLTQNLNLTDEQQTKIKPIVEQERGEVGAECFTPTIPRKERFKKWESIVLASDTKMKPILTSAQWQKLQDIRKEQKQDLKKILEQEKN
jgi:hypothetical protein